MRSDSSADYDLALQLSASPLFAQVPETTL